MWALLSLLVLIRTVHQTATMNNSLPKLLAKEVASAYTHLQNQAEVIYGVIRRLNWKSVTVFTDSVKDDWTSVLDALTNGSLLRISIVSRLGRDSFNYHNSKAVFANDNDRLYMVICREECVQKIFDIVTSELTEDFLFSSKWLIVTDRILPLTSGRKFENLAYILPKTCTKDLPVCTMEVTTVKVEGDTKTLTEVPDINIDCENKDYTDRMYRESVFPNLYNGLSGRTVRIGVEEWLGYILKTTSTNGTVKYVGFGIDVIEALATVLNFKAKYVEYPNKVIVWQTLLKMVENKEIDMIAAPFLLSVDRLDVMDFTYPVAFNQLLVFYSLPREVDLRWRLIVDILSWPVIALMFLSLVCTGFILGTFENINKYWMITCFEEVSKKKSGSMFDNVWFLFGNLLNQGHSNYVRKDKYISSRLVVSAWCVFCLVLSVTFTAYLVPSLGVNKPFLLFPTLRDLINHGEYHWGTYGEGNEVIMNYLKNALNKDYQELYRQMIKFNETDSQVLPRKFEDVERKLLTENYAFIFLDEAMQSLYASHCEIVYINEKLDERPNAFPMAKNSAYTKLFTKWIMYFVENGQLDRWRQKWFPRRRQCTMKKTKSVSVTLLHTQSVFILTTCGIVLSAITFSFELFLHFCKH